MDIGLGTSSVPPISSQDFAQKSAPQAAKTEAPRQMLLAAQAAQKVLMFSTLSLTEIARIVVARHMVPIARPQRYRDERRPGDFVKKVKIAKSEAMNQQAKGRS